MEGDGTASSAVATGFDDDRIQERRTAVVMLGGKVGLGDDEVGMGPFPVLGNAAQLLPKWR